VPVKSLNTRPVGRVFFYAVSPRLSIDPSGNLD